MAASWAGVMTVQTRLSPPDLGFLHCSHKNFLLLAAPGPPLFKAGPSDPSLNTKGPDVFSQSCPCNSGACSTSLVGG